MKIRLLSFFTLLIFILSAQEGTEGFEFETVQCLDNSNKIIINLKAKSTADVVLLEKDYIVSSDRVKAINAKFTSEDFSDGRIIKVEHQGMKDFSEDWLELIKVLINTEGVLKLKEHEEGEFLMLVSEDYSTKELEKLAVKANWPIRLSEEI